MVAWFFLAQVLGRRNGLTDDGVRMTYGDSPLSVGRRTVASASPSRSLIEVDS